MLSSKLKLILKSRIPQRFQNVKYCFKAGDKASICKAFTSSEVKTFSEISLDNNPIHTDEEFAKKSRFGRCIVHGVLINGYITERLISAVCSTKLPGPGAVYVSQTLKFKAPAYVGEPVTAEVEVLTIDRLLMTCATVVKETKSGKVLMEGEAKLMMPRPRKKQDST